MLVIGGNSLGKSELSIFVSKLSTVSKSIVVDNEVHNLSLYEYGTDTIYVGQLFDAIVAVFAVDDPKSLKELIDPRISFIQRILEVFRGARKCIPLLLVGTRAYRRRELGNPSDLFPLALGPTLALLLGAFRYVECDDPQFRCTCIECDNSNFGQHFCNGFQTLCLETVHATFLRFHPFITNKDLQNMLMDKLSSCGKWADAIEGLRLTVLTADSVKLSNHLKFCQKPNEGLASLENLQSFVNALRNLDDQLLKTGSQLQVLSIEQLRRWRYLEVERIQITYEGVAAQYVQSKHRLESSVLLCMFNVRRNNSSNKICQRVSNLEELEKLICDKLNSDPDSFPVSLSFFNEDCNYVIELFNRIGPLLVRSVVIVACKGTLTFQFLSSLKGLKHLVIAHTQVDIASISFPLHLRNTLKHLVMSKCNISKEVVPPEIAELENLTVLNICNNRFRALPKELGSLSKLKTLLIDRSRIIFPPVEVLCKDTEEIIKFLSAFKEETTENKEAKLIIVGQERVGKSTLIKAITKRSWFNRNGSPPKTDGVQISRIPLNDINCKVFDLAGDVEYLNTHTLFLSPGCLHLVVFDLSQFIVGRESHSTNHFGRLELWLETIAAHSRESYVNIVATHADHSSINKEMLHTTRRLLMQIICKYRSGHLASFQDNDCEECIICNPKKLPNDLIVSISEEYYSSPDNLATITSTSPIPHILGYFEVSSLKTYPHAYLSTTNPSIQSLKSATATSISYLMKLTLTDKIPTTWLSFHQSLIQRYCDDGRLRKQPLMSMSDIKVIAFKSGVIDDKMISAMLRFFHSQGEHLWYENLPEMKDIVIIDPQWLSDQLSTLITYRSSADVISDGILQLEDLSKVWDDVSEVNCLKLLSLFRNVGLCFSISDCEELFPCNLPIGWPNREMWSSLPKPSERQTSLLFTFNFLPPSFFPRMIVAVNKMRESFASNVEPLYYRFHIVYITKDQAKCASHQEVSMSATTENTSMGNSQDIKVLHAVHYELLPHKYSLKATVRGPFPCLVVPVIRRTVDSVKSCSYPGITYKEHILCPECELRKVQDPAKFETHKSHDGACSKGHRIENTEDLLCGKFDSGIPMSLVATQVGRVVIKALEDHYCPKLFVVLPINMESLSLNDFLVYSILRDGYAVHLLCECPDQWHFVGSPGFRLDKAKDEFFAKYGARACKVLRMISKLGSLDPFTKIGSVVADSAAFIADRLQDLVSGYFDKYPFLKASVESYKDDLRDLKSSSGLQRSELARFLNIVAEERNFGPLICTYVDKYDEWLWLCEEHSRRFEIIELE